MWRRTVMVLILCLALPPVAGAAADPASFVADLGKRAIAVLGTTGAVRQQRFREVFRDGFDIHYCAQAVLGRYWPLATAAEQQEFMRLYEDYVVFGYSARLGALGGQVFKVTGTRPAGAGVTVVGDVRGANDPTGAEIDWQVIPAGAGWRVTDVVVDGISMNETQRSEFAAVLQRNGGQLTRLFALMREKNTSMAQ